MIKVNCDISTKLKLVDMTPFQGTLKKRTQQDLDKLKESLKVEGLIMPFAIWKHDDKNLLLDGHGRREALVQLSLEDVNILDAEWPVVYIEADNEDDAKKALLQITSSYGKITKQGALNFISSIPTYTAPSISKYTAKVTPFGEFKVGKTHVKNDKCIIKIQVNANKVEQIKEILGQFDYIKVL